MPTTAADQDSFPLPFATRGKWLSLIEIRANDKLRKRLADLGLNVGMTIRVMQADGAGSLIVAVQNDSRLAIGCGVAQKILVKYAEGEA